MYNSSLFALAERLAIKLASGDKQFLYHLKGPEFKGKIIYPLAELETIYPAIFKEQSKKYKGRESQLETIIPLLNCKWKEVVNFSSVNPIKIFQLEELLGLPGYKNSGEVEILKFDIQDLKEFPMVAFDETLSPKNSKAYNKISAKCYKEVEFISAETCKYFAECKLKNEAPLIFGGVEHILIQGQIDISLAEILKFKK